MYQFSPKVSNWYFKIFFLQFSLLLFIKIKNFFSICVSCHPLHDISKTPNFYWVPLTKKVGSKIIIKRYKFFDFFLKNWHINLQVEEFPTEIFLKDNLRFILLPLVRLFQLSVLTLRSRVFLWLVKKRRTRSTEPEISSHPTPCQLRHKAQFSVIYQNCDYPTYSN